MSGGGVPWRLWRANLGAKVISNRQKPNASMTALTKYQRLECTGLWRESAQDQRREVGVRFGEATLILSDPKSDTALTHWSLPAVERANPGALPAIFTPGSDAPETLELSDPDMIAALETVRGAVEGAVPKPGRLRAVLLGSATIAILALGLFWVPGALVSHTASVVPAAKRAEIGQGALDDLVRLTGAPCDNPLGLEALDRMAERVFGPVNTPVLHVLPDGIDGAQHLPGDVIVVSRDLVEAASGPEAAAGAVLVERLRSRAHDPMIPLLEHAGLAATFRLLTSGDLPEDALKGYGEVLLRRKPDPLPDQKILAAFEAAQIPSTPYGFAMDASGKATEGLISGDPFKGLSPSPLIPDGNWIALQTICTD
jgi:hypothetical protein